MPDLLPDGTKPQNQESVIASTEMTDEENVAEQTETVMQDTETAAAKPKKFIQVDDSYFDDAVFIGDSRTVGLYDYGGLDHSDFFATVGMNIYDLWKDAFCEVNGKKVTLEEALKAKQYKKVYFQIGINEMGRGTLDGFMNEYQNAVEKFKTLQPDAVIYVQAIMHVTQKNLIQIRFLIIRALMREISAYSSLRMVFVCFILMSMKWCAMIRVD